MTHETLGEMHRRGVYVARESKEGLERLLSGVLQGYHIACDAFGNTSKDAGEFDKLACLLQQSISALDKI